MRGLVPGDGAGPANCVGATTGGGVAPAPCNGPDPELGGKTDVGIMVGPMAAKASGGGGTAVLATLMGAGMGIGAGGGVGGYISGGGTSLGAGAAAPAWSLAPQPRQNL